MSDEKTKKHEVEQLIDKAAAAEKSEDALRFSQAANNVANALSEFQRMKETWR